MGYDQLVRDLLAQEPNLAPGTGRNDPSAISFYLANDFRPENLAGSTARLFLGATLECAQCHDHPFARWSRNQFWEYAAFFTDIRQNRPGAPSPRGVGRTVGFADAKPSCTKSSP